jgi:ABC-type phosphate transport system ATPase subunit/protein-tyrosine phosphatase
LWLLHIVFSRQNTLMFTIFGATHTLTQEMMVLFAALAAFLLGIVTIAVDVVRRNQRRIEAESRPIDTSIFQHLNPAVSPADTAGEDTPVVAEEVPAAPDSEVIEPDTDQPAATYDVPSDESEAAPAPVDDIPSSNTFSHVPQEELLPVPEPHDEPAGFAAPENAPETAPEPVRLVEPLPAPEPVLVCENFGAGFGGKIVLADVTLEILDQGITTLMGPVGTGKSTVLRALSGMLSQSGLFKSWGNVYFRGAIAGPENRPLLVAQRIQLVQRSALENLIFHLRDRTADLPIERQREWASQWLTQAGVPDVIALLDRPFMELDQLSQRIITILREAAAEPALLMIDEPTTGLSEADAGVLLGMLERLAGFTPLLVALQNHKHARKISNQIILLAGGRVQAACDADSFFNNPPNAAVAQFIATGTCTVPAPDANSIKPAAPVRIPESTPVTEPGGAPPPLTAAALAAIKDEIRNALAADMAPAEQAQAPEPEPVAESEPLPPLIAEPAFAESEPAAPEMLGEPETLPAEPLAESESTFTSYAPEPHAPEPAAFEIADEPALVFPAPFAEPEPEFAAHVPEPTPEIAANFEPILVEAAAEPDFVAYTPEPAPEIAEPAFIPAEPVAEPEFVAPESVAYAPESASQDLTSDFEPILAEPAVEPDFTAHTPAPAEPDLAADFEPILIEPVAEPDFTSYALEPAAPEMAADFAPILVEPAAAPHFTAYAPEPATPDLATDFAPILAEPTAEPDFAAHAAEPTTPEAAADIEPTLAEPTAEPELVVPDSVAYAPETDTSEPIYTEPLAEAKPVADAPAPATPEIDLPEPMMAEPPMEPVLEPALHEPEPVPVAPEPAAPAPEIYAFTTAEPEFEPVTYIPATLTSAEPVTIDMDAAPAPVSAPVSANEPVLHATLDPHSIDDLPPISLSANMIQTVPLPPRSAAAQMGATPSADARNEKAAVTRYPGSNTPGPRGFVWIEDGRLAATPMPGISAPIDQDLDMLKQAGITVLITLTEGDFPQDILARHGLRNVHFPIADRKAPTTGETDVLVNQMHDMLDRGEVLGVHCLAGLGRTGTILAAYMVKEKGVSAQVALNQIRRFNRQFVQTDDQEDFLIEYEVQQEQTVLHKRATNVTRLLE